MHSRVCPNRTACEELIREVAPLDHELYAHARRWLRGTIAAALTLTLTLTLTLSLTLTLTLIVTLTLTLTRCSGRGGTAQRRRAWGRAST